MNTVEKLWKEYSAQLRSEAIHLARSTGDPVSEAEDLVVEAFVRVWKAVMRGRGPTTDKLGWLKKILRNIWRDKVAADNAIKRGGTKFTLNAHDIQDAAGLISKLKGNEPVSKFLWNLLSKTPELAEGSPSAVAKALNVVIEKSELCEAFYNGELSKSRLSNEALTDLADSFPEPVAWDVRRLNRWFLHELFPANIKAPERRAKDWSIDEPDDDGQPREIPSEEPSPLARLLRVEELQGMRVVNRKFLDDLKSCIRELDAAKQEAFKLKYLAIDPDTQKPFTQKKIAEISRVTVGAVNNRIQDALEILRNCMAKNGWPLLSLNPMSEGFSEVCDHLREESL